MGELTREEGLISRGRLFRISICDATDAHKARMWRPPRILTQLTFLRTKYLPFPPPPQRGLSTRGHLITERKCTQHTFSLPLSSNSLTPLASPVEPSSGRPRDRVRLTSSSFLVPKLSVSL